MPRQALSARNSPKLAIESDRHFGVRVNSASVQGEFDVRLVGSEFIVRHRRQGHAYWFPIKSNGDVECCGAVIEPGLSANRSIWDYLLDAHKVALTAAKELK